jgi:hypothetical protein
MAKGEYYTPEFKEQAVKMAVGLDRTYDLLQPLQGQRFRLDAHPDRSRSARPRRGQTPGMTAAGSRPSRTGNGGEVGVQAISAQASRDDGDSLAGGTELELVLDGVDEWAAGCSGFRRPGIDAPVCVPVRVG